VSLKNFVSNSEERTKLKCFGSKLLWGNIWTSQNKNISRAKEKYIYNIQLLGFSSLFTIVSMIKLFCMSVKLGFTVKEEHRMRNGALRKIPGSKREKVTGGWRKLHNKDLCNLYSMKYY
jgi:hypothetical protein